MKMLKSFSGILLGLLLVLVFISRGIPHSLAAGYTFGVVAPAIAFAGVAAFVIALALDRSRPKRSRGGDRPGHPRR